MIWVYFPSSPCIRILELPLIADVCWVCMPVLSASIIRISPGFILAFSSSSSPEIISTRVGILSMVRLLRVAPTTTASSSWPSPLPLASSKKITGEFWGGGGGGGAGRGAGPAERDRRRGGPAGRGGN